MLTKAVSFFVLLTAGNSGQAYFFSLYVGPSLTLSSSANPTFVQLYCLNSRYFSLDDQSFWHQLLMNSPFTPIV